MRGPDSSSDNTQSEDVLAEEFEFDGAKGMSYQEFLKRIRGIAFREGKSRDSAWMVDLAALHLSGDALTWYDTLEANVQEDWHLFRKAMVGKYGGDAETTADDTTQDATSDERHEPSPTDDPLLPARIEIVNWTAPILASNLRLPKSECQWLEEARQRKAKYGGNNEVVYWRLVETWEPIPQNAIPTGSEYGNNLFSVRIWKEGGLTLGKQVRGGLFWTNTRAWIPWWGREVPWEGPFEILVGNPSAVRWVSPRDAGRFYAVEGGSEASRPHALFIAQFNQAGQLEPGKVFSGDGQGHFGWWLFEFHNHDFRVLAWA